MLSKVGWARSLLANRDAVCAMARIETPKDSCPTALTRKLKPFGAPGEPDRAPEVRGLDPDAPPIGSQIVLRDGIDHVFLH